MQEPFTPQFFRRLQQLRIHTRRAFLGSRQGSHISLRRGHGLEFSDYRVYSAGDDFRHIDWGIYGKTDRLYVRQFRDEQNLNVMFILDASASMALPEGAGKFKLAKDLALALGYVALSGGDSVLFSLLGQKNTPKFTGPKAISRAFTSLSEIKPEGIFNYVDEIRAAIAKQKIPGKCFFISDFLFDHQELFSSLDYIRGRNFEVSLIQILSPQELTLEFGSGDRVVVDAESGQEIKLSLGMNSKREYASLLAEHVEAIERYCFKAGISHLLVSSADSVSNIVLTRLPEMGLLK